MEKALEDNGMHILVVNSGSSSIKSSMFDSGSNDSFSNPRCLFNGQVSGIGRLDAQVELRGADGTDLRDGRQSQVKAETPVDAIRLLLDAVCVTGMPAVEAVGYRVVHPGAKLDAHQRITAKVLSDLEEAVSFAPLHDPEAIGVIRNVVQRFPNVPHYACFDTVFHGTMPEEATTYPMPQACREQGVRRYGFHGLSCESIVRQMRRQMYVEGMEFPKRMAIAHLGSGCSVTALVDGHSVDTTME